MHLNLHLLRIFYQVIQWQSFSKAAENLCISQSAVSKGVRELERQLELTLIERGTAGTRANKKIILTSSGRALFEHASAIFSMERVAITDLQARLELSRGHLIIGASTTIASYWLPNYLTHFHQTYPEIELEIKVGNTATMKQHLINCDIDLALVEGTIEDERIDIKQWQQEELHIITGPQRQISIDDLNKQLWIMRESGSGTFTTAQKMFTLLGIEPPRKLTLASNEGIARVVASGTGVSILPACTVQELISLKQLTTLNPPQIQQMTRTLYLLTLKQRPISTLLQAFIKQLYTL